MISSDENGSLDFVAAQAAMQHPEADEARLKHFCRSVSRLVEQRTQMIIEKDALGIELTANCDELIGLRI